MKFSISAVSALLVCGGLAALPAPASAHFRLLAPPPATAQNAQGDPQKEPACGGGAFNNTVTTVKAGDMVTVRWAETVYHPGHYRISLAKTESEFKDPVVSGAQCARAAIMNPVAMPVLADGVNAKTTRTNLMFETQVKIPADFTCDKCFLQVTQFMSQHGEPCFYYHCAQLKVEAAGTGGTGGNDGGAGDMMGGRDMMGAGGAGGTGGSGGSGGSTGGAGGSTGGSGGSTGGAGGSTGGSGGSTGGSGGSTGGSGGSTGGSGSGTGGSGTSRGGSSGSGTGGSGTTNPPSGGGSTGGCSVGGDQPSAAVLGFAALMFGLLARRRRR